MNDQDWLAERFQEQRRHLRAVAYRILGSLSEADDALQEAWLRASRSDAGSVENLGGWFTTIVARVSLNMLRARKAKREESFEERLPDPVVSSPNGANPEQAALIADSVGLAMLVVLETLAPAERVAFVLHDLFDLPFDEIAPIVGRSPATARQLASRARRRVRGAEVRAPDPDLGHQRKGGDAFYALVAMLDPDVVARFDAGPARPEASVVLRGAAAVAGQALRVNHPAALARPALVTGAAGLVVPLAGQPVAVAGFTVSRGKIVEIDVVADPERLRGLDL